MPELTDPRTQERPEKIAEKIMTELKKQNPDSRKVALAVAQSFKLVSENNKAEALPNPSRMPAIQKALNEKGFNQAHLSKLQTIYKKDGDFFNEMNIKDKGFNQFFQTLGGTIKNKRASEVRKRAQPFIDILQKAAQLPIEKKIQYMDKHQDRIFKMFEDMRNAGLDKELQTATQLFKEKFIAPGVQHETKQKPSQPMQRTDHFKKRQLQKTTPGDRKNAAKRIEAFRKTQKNKAKRKPLPKPPPRPRGPGRN